MRLDHGRRISMSTVYHRSVPGPIPFRTHYFPDHTMGPAG
jgi:hypothetical protein